MNLLDKLKNIQIDKSNGENQFTYLAKMLMNETILRVGDNDYRIVEVEFYYYKNGSHEDPFVHQDDEQYQNGTWYFHGSGLDLTFGKEDQSKEGQSKNDHIYGGILIRGICNIENDNFISGPLNVVKELFKSIGNVGSHPIEFGISADSTLTEGKIIASPRVGLNSKKDTNDKFHQKPYRFIWFNDNVSAHRFKEKTNVANYMLENNSGIWGNKDKINKIFGYNILS